MSLFPCAGVGVGTLRHREGECFPALTQPALSGRALELVPLMLCCGASQRRLGPPVTWSERTYHHQPGYARSTVPGTVLVLLMDSGPPKNPGVGMRTPVLQMRKMGLRDAVGFVQGGAWLAMWRGQARAGVPRSPAGGISVALSLYRY